MRRRMFAIAVPALLFASCNSAGDAVAQGQTPAPGASGGPFKVEELGKFEEPWAIAFLPDGRALVTEKKGAVKLWAANGEVADVSGVPQVAYGGQGGLLDIALAPDYATSHWVYLTYSEPRPAGSSLALARAKLDIRQVVCVRAPCPPQVALTDLQVLFRGGSDGAGGQFGGVIAFAPDGRSLFLSSGERQRFTPAQDPNQTLGKILHLTLDGKPAPGNPWAGKRGSETVPVFDPPRNSETAKTTPAKTTYRFEGANLAPAETWTSGHRNPYGLAFAPDGRLWESEMGPRGGDEFNLIEKGKNYGWPIVSNGDNYDGTVIPDHPTRPEFQAPAVFWNPSISPGGMMFYSGKLWPQWKGSAFQGALSGQALIRIDVKGATAAKADQWTMGSRIRDVAEGPDGAIYLLEDGGRSGGRLLKLTPAS